MSCDESLLVYTITQKSDLAYLIPDPAGVAQVDLMMAEYPTTYFEGAATTWYLVTRTPVGQDTRRLCILAEAPTLGVQGFSRLSKQLSGNDSAIPTFVASASGSPLAVVGAVNIKGASVEVSRNMSTVLVLANNVKLFSLFDAVVVLRAATGEKTMILGRMHADFAGALDLEMQRLVTTAINRTNAATAIVQPEFDSAVDNAVRAEASINMGQRDVESRKNVVDLAMMTLTNARVRRHVQTLGQTGGRFPSSSERRYVIKMSIIHTR